MAAIPFKKIPPPRTVSGTRPAQGSGAYRSSIPAPNPARVEIELNIFTDQPNPRWLLASARAAELLPYVPAESSLIPALLTGYRGFTIHVDSDAGKRSVQVFHNTELERWLLRSGRFCLSEDLAQFVDKQLG